jgi:hypothetical protein
MSTFTFSIPHFGQRKFTAHESSKFHALGDPDDLTDYTIVKDAMFDVFKHEAKEDNKTPEQYFISTFEDEDEAEYVQKKVIDKGKKLNADIWYDALKNKKDVLNGYYNDATKYVVKTDDAILPGDIVYIISEYESRQYYGLYLIVLDKDGEKKLNGYGDGITLSKIDKELVKVFFEHNPNYFYRAERDANELVASYNRENNNGQYNNSNMMLTANIKSQIGGRRRKTLKRKQTLRRKRNNTR